MLARNTKNEIKCLEKQEFVFENVENNENETETRYFVERSKQKENGKSETSINKHIFEKKVKWIQEGKGVKKG